MKKGLVIGVVAVVCWLIVFGAAYTALHVGLGVERMDALKNFGKTTQGSVAAKRPDQHRAVIYYFNVDGIQYTGSWGAGLGNPEFDDLHIGDPVIIKYDEDNPFDSVMGDPGYYAQINGRMAYLGAFLIATIIIGQALVVYLVAHYIRKSRRRIAAK